MRAFTKSIKSIGIYIGLSVFIGLLWVMSSYPDIPSTAIRWLWILAFVMLILPLQVGLEILIELLWENKATDVVKQKTAAKSFSLLRIFYAVVLVLLFLGVVSGAAYGLNLLRT